MTEESPLMDHGEHTQAADTELGQQPDPETAVVADGTPTAAAELAWSECNDGDTELLGERRHSQTRWLIVIAALIVAVAAASVVGVFYWQRDMQASPSHASNRAEAAPKPPASSAQPDTPDARFIALYKQRGWTGNPSQQPDVIRNAHAARDDLSAGASKTTVIGKILNFHPGVKRSEAELFVNTVIDAYRPQLAPPGVSPLDAEFIQAEKNLHLAPAPNPAYAASYAREVCTRLGQGQSMIDADEFVKASTIWDTFDSAAAFVNGAVVFYCAEYTDAAKATNG